MTVNTQVKKVSAVGDGRNADAIGSRAGAPRDFRLNSGSNHSRYNLKLIVGVDNYRRE